MNIFWIIANIFAIIFANNCQAQGHGQGQRQASKLDPEVGSVMAWPTHHHHHTTFFELKTAN